MIFVTVGTQLAFDRLVGIVDRWAGQHAEAEVVAQIGPSQQQFANLRTMPFVSPSESARLVATAEVIVSHAGMGSVLTALKHRRPIIIMPRIAAMGEHRNEHQLATARWLSGRSGIFVAEEAGQLVDLLNARSTLQAQGQFSDHANEDLIGAVRQFIRDA